MTQNRTWSYWRKLALTAIILLGPVGLHDQAVNALPPIDAPFAGDPRLESLASTPLNMTDFPAWSNGAFRDLSPSVQQNIIDFLRAQVVADAVEQQ